MPGDDPPTESARPHGKPYLALLRGINVGGKNLIKMPALKACFENNGFTDVATYIQSGNVFFKSTEKDHRAHHDRHREDALRRVQLRVPRRRGVA